MYRDTKLLEGMSGLRSSEFIGSEEFTVAYLSGLMIIGVGLPLMIECARHILGGQTRVACIFGLGAIVVFGVGGWKLSSALKRANEKYAVE